MPNVNVKVGGTTATQVIDVEYDTTEGGDVGQALITVGNTQTNRDLFSFGSDVVIEREDPNNPGTYNTVWRGEVVGKPSNTQQRNVTLDVECETKIGQIEFGKVGRPFIERDTGTIVKNMVEEVVEPETKTHFVTVGSDLTDWSSDAQNFELGKITDRQLNEYGHDFFYLDFGEEESGTWKLTNTSIGSSTLPGRRILKMEMRMLINNPGSVFDGALEIRDYDGINYVWDLDLPDYVGFKDYELLPEDATFPDSPSLTTNGTVELRLENTGGLPEDRALALDMIRATTFSVNDRGTSVSTAGVETTGRTVTRKLEGSVLNVATKLATEDGAVVYLDKNDVLHYESAGDTTTPPGLNIKESGSEHIVDADIDRDGDVRNRVTVQGKGDLQATFEDAGSIQFYNSEAPKEEPIVDTSIRTRDGLEARARGYLNEHAWEDTAMTFTLAEPEYEDVEVGQSIDVEYSSEDVSGTFIVSNVKTTPEGYIRIGLTGNTT